MWKCEKCGREFKRTNQGHYCGKAPETVEEYMETQPPEARAHIAGLREIIRRCAPEATERIAWSMPAYRRGKDSVSFAACQKHISLYVGADVLEKLGTLPDSYPVQKNAVYLPYDRELPSEIIENILLRSFGTDD